MAAIKRRPEVRERKNAQRRLVNNPARHVINRRRGLSKYGLTIADYDLLVAAQDGKCYLCGHIPNGGHRPTTRLVVDHSHTTGANRKLLCNGCNRGMGYLNDDPALLRAAADYIEAHAA